MRDFLEGVSYRLRRSADRVVLLSLKDEGPKERARRPISVSQPELVLRRSQPIEELRAQTHVIEKRFIEFDDSFIH